MQNDLKKSRIVYETEHFVLFPTLGCFQIGYLLIMPKQHFMCFGELDCSLIEELDLIISKLSNFLQMKYKSKYIIFEHGTRDLSKLTSSSIMHAHIHIMPFEKPFIDFLPEECKLRKIDGFADLKEEKCNYLFFQDINKINYIVDNNNYPSQFFRRIACKALGIEKFWDWKDYRFLDTMEETIDYYKGI